MKIALKLNGGSGTGDSDGTTMPIYCTTTLKVTKWALTTTKLHRYRTRASESWKG